MRISFAGAVGRLPQSRYKDWLSPAAVTLDGILHDSDDRSVSRRIALIAFSVRILSAVIAYVSQILLARWMGDFEYGIFVAVWVGAVVLGGFACLGFQTALLRFVPEYVERGDASSLRGVIVGSRVLGIVASTLFAALGAAGLYAFGDSLSSYYLVPLYLGAITLPMLAIGEIQDGVARSFYWANLSFWPTFIIRPVLILAFMWLAVRFGAAPDAITAMVAVIAATYVTSLGQLASVERRVRKAVPDGPRRYRPALWIGIALPIFIVEGFFNLLTNIDIIIVSFLMEPDRVAVYFAAAKTLALVHFVYFAVRAGGAQRFSKYYASGNRGRLEDFVRDTLHWTFWPSLAMVSLLLLFGRSLLGLFGPNFIDGYPLLFIISIGLVVRASIGPAESLLTMAGQHNICAAVYTAAFALSVALNFALIPRYGLQGAAAATTLALVAEAIAVYVLTVTRLGIHCSIVAALWPRRAAAGAS